MKPEILDVIILVLLLLVVTIAWSSLQYLQTEDLQTEEEPVPIAFYYLTDISNNETYMIDATEPLYIYLAFYTENYTSSINWVRLCPENTSYQSATCDCAINTTQPCLLECFKCIK